MTKIIAYLVMMSMKMMKCRSMENVIMIKRPGNLVTIVRSRLDTGSDDKLTEHEEIINELYNNQREQLIAFGLTSYAKPYGDITIRKVTERVDKFLKQV